MTRRQEFIDAVVINMSPQWGNYSEREEQSRRMFDVAEALANEREKRYGPFDDETKEVDPYEVDWSKAPEWANWHAVDENGDQQWTKHRPIISGTIWMWNNLIGGVYRNDIHESNPNWRESLRKRP